MIELLYGILLWGFLLIILPMLIKKMDSVSKFTLRRKPKLLKFYKSFRSFEKILGKAFIFILKAVGIILIIVLLCYLFSWINDNPLWVIIFLLILILLKK